MVFEIHNLCELNIGNKTVVHSSKCRELSHYAAVYLDLTKTAASNDLSDDCIRVALMNSMPFIDGLEAARS